MAALIVALVIELLGAADFRTRERCMAWLMGEPLAIHQVLRGETHADPEVRARCKWISDRWHRDHADELLEKHRPPGWECWPWIDSLTDWPDGYCDLKNNYLTLARAGRPTAQKWEDYSEATRLWLRDLVSTRQPIDDLLGKLCEGHRDWCRRNGFALPPPARKPTCKNDKDKVK